MLLRLASHPLCFALLLVGLVGCSKNPPVNTTMMETEFAEQLLAPPNYLAGLVKQTPDVKFQPMAGGIRKASSQVRLPTGESMTVWVYQPDPLPPGKLPCVFIAPAGTMLIHGMMLSDGDVQEHLPWAKAGFAVVAYELSGHADAEKSSDDQLKLAADNFRDAKSGLLNAQVAMAFAKEKLSFVDPDQFYTAGHSSAGTMALYVAEMEPRVKGSIAFMPAVDVRATLGLDVMTYLQTRSILTEAGPYVSAISPATHIERLSRPTFIFLSANDRSDINGPADTFVAKLRELGKDVTVVRAPGGGHLEPMLDPGIPMAIEWLKMVTQSR
ncbi:prolyl oligopeptidase family serine peptidase [Bremerella sp. JC817]|uniref:alpha/beta hydrolase family protein n=1 Tax=Bremerella sp. JC817 TaxID=3231756 RepID=UPI003457AE3E